MELVCGALIISTSIGPALQLFCSITNDGRIRFDVTREAISSFVGETEMRLNSTRNELKFEISVGHVLRSASPRIAVTLTKVLEKDGLSYIQWVVLLTLCELGTSKMTELAR